MRLRCKAKSLFAVLSLAAVGVPVAAYGAPPDPPRPPPAPTAQPVPAPPPPDLPPPPPPPWTTNPGTSTAGSEVVPPAPDATNATPPVPPPVDVAAAQAEARRLTALEHEVSELRHRERTRLSHEDLEKLSWLRHFKVSGFLQPQYVRNWFDTNASPNAAGIDSNAVTANAAGTTNNTDFFRLRRARLKVEFTPSDWARFVMEIDPVEVGGNAPGIGTIARNVEAVGIAHWARWISTEFALGIFKIPFGYEVLQSDADRPFIERSWGEQNMTPGEFDTGMRAYTQTRDKNLNVQVAVVNGVTQGEKTFAIVPDLNHGKDLVGRLNYNIAGIVELGVSGYYGQGTNVDATNLRFKQFTRWAVNGELAFHHNFMPAVGQTRLFAEITGGQNMDRGTKYGVGIGLPKIPTDVTQDVTNLNELAYWIRVEQDLTKWATLGLRYDTYTPDTTGSTNSRDTFGVVGVAHFTTGLQAMLEYDHATDNVHSIAPAGATPTAGQTPPSKHIDTVSAVLQVRF